jgi:hypothetical protein
MSDTLATLQQALKPKTGMRPIPFPTESYQHPSKPLQSKRLLNYAAEVAPPDSRSPFVLVPTPGLVVRRQIGTGPWHAFNTNLVDQFYVVSGDTAYRCDEAVADAIGVVGEMLNPYPITMQAMVTIAVNTQYAVICVPPRLYYCLHTDAALTEIDTTGWQTGGAGTVTYVDGYWIVTQYGPGTAFVVSALRDPSSWDALDFANVEGMENHLLRGIRHRGELWLFGVTGGAVWYDAGAADFPFRPMAGGAIAYGAVAPSIASIDGSLWWVSRDPAVFRSDGYKSTRVSTHAVETILEQTDPEQWIGYAHFLDGHAYYCITRKDDFGLQTGITLCYDAATGKWHDRSSGVNGDGAWRPLVSGRFGERVYVGDADGWMYIVDPNDGTDNGVPIIRQATLPPLYVDGHRVFCARVEVEMEVGQIPVIGDVILDWSDDGGNNFTGGPRVMSGGAGLEYRHRVYTTRTGSFRERMFRITTRGRTTLYGVEADVAAPASTSGANS